MIRSRWNVLMAFWLCALMVHAQDIAFETREGRAMRLSELPSDRLTLLLLFDPDCTDCRQELFGMRHSTPLRKAMEQKKVQVACVSTVAADTLWRETVAELPTTWVVAVTRTDLTNSKVYDISELPVLYLLDKKKKVLQQAYSLGDLLERLNQ